MAISIDREHGFQIRNKIAKEFWDRLSRQLTCENVEKAIFDSKAEEGSQPVVFLSKHAEKEQSAYYKQDSEIQLKTLPDLSEYNDEIYFKLAREPGILGLAFTSKGVPEKYVVPGGRFNEFYGWDSYFVALGLINDERYDLAANIASQFSFEIRNYGKILNGNRTYYLGRSHPPFLTDLTWRLHEHSSKEQVIDWFKAAIQEYETVWMAQPRYDSETGLSKYVAQGRGFPPEVEPGHFDSLVAPYAAKRGLSPAKYVEEYQSQLINEPELDDYLRHDRSLRESGHDKSTRFEGCCADLVTIDLASLLYKYETDIARACEIYGEELGQSAERWKVTAEKRREAVNKYLWDSQRGVYGDFNVVSRELNTKKITSATNLWALWSGLASEDQANSLIEHALPKLEFEGGLAAASNTAAKGWQWDYPAGWAPHQILAWEGLEKYGRPDIAKRLSLKWLGTILKSARTTEGAIFEKYDVTGVANPHEVLAEYGNQGSNETGFGWTNSSFALGWDRYAQST